MKEKKRASFKQVLIRILLTILVLGLIGGLSLTAINVYMVQSVKSDINEINGFTEQLKASDEHYEAVIVLGCSVHKDGQPSSRLADRLYTAARVFETGCADYILVSGDSQDPDNYDEITAMVNYLIDEGIDEEDIISDPLGVSTYETMNRASYEFNIESAVVVTSGYHLSRSVYICHSFDIDSVGVSAIDRSYITPYEKCREVVARGKDFLLTLIKPEKDFFN